MPDDIGRIVPAETPLDIDELRDLVNRWLCRTERVSAAVGFGLGEMLTEVKSASDSMARQGALHTLLNAIRLEDGPVDLIDYVERLINAGRARPN